MQIASKRAKVHIKHAGMERYGLYSAKSVVKIGGLTKRSATIKFRLSSGFLIGVVCFY